MRFRAEVASLEGFLAAGPDAYPARRPADRFDPLRDPESRYSVFLTIFGKEIASVRALAADLAFGYTTGIGEDLLERELFTAKNLNRIWFQDVVAVAHEGEWVAVGEYRVLDHDEQLSNLLERLSVTERHPERVYLARQPGEH